MNLETWNLLCEWFLPPVLYVVLCLLSIQARLPRQPFYRCETQKTTIAFLCNTNGAGPDHWHHQNCSFTGHQKLTFWLILPFVLRDPNLPLFTASQDQGMRVGMDRLPWKRTPFPSLSWWAENKLWTRKHLCQWSSCTTLNVFGGVLYICGITIELDMSGTKPRE